MEFSAVNTIWVLLGAALVFFMQAGFAMVETGFPDFPDGFLCNGSNHCFRCNGRAHQIHIILHLQRSHQRGCISYIRTLDLGRR